jgi:hypothetical protein
MPLIGPVFFKVAAIYLAVSESIPVLSSVYLAIMTPAEVSALMPAFFGSIVTWSIALKSGVLFFFKAAVPSSLTSPLSPLRLSTGNSSMTDFLTSNSIYS